MTLRPIYVRREQAELLLGLRADFETAQGIADQANARLNNALAAVLAGLVEPGTPVEGVAIEDEQGIIMVPE